MCKLRKKSTVALQYLPPSADPCVHDAPSKEMQRMAFPASYVWFPPGRTTVHPSLSASLGAFLFPHYRLQTMGYAAAAAAAAAAERHPVIGRYFSNRVLVC